MIELRNYQRSIVKEEHERDNVLVIAPMGSGKTVSTLTTIGLTVLQRPEIRNVLILAPLRVARTVWEQENDKYDMGLNISYCVTALDVKIELLRDRPHCICVCSVSRISEIPHGCWDWVIIDESTLFGNKMSQRSGHARRLCSKKITPKLKQLCTYFPIEGCSIKKRTLLTGTPVHGGYEKLWHQIFLLDGGAALGTSLTQFRQTYMKVKYTMSGVTTVYEIREEMIPIIHARIKHLIYIVEESAPLPPVLYKTIPLYLPEKRKQEYDIFERDAILHFREETGIDGYDGSVKSLVSFCNAAQGSKLRQLATGCVYANQDDKKNYEYSVTHREKIDALAEVLDYTDGGILVAYEFISEYKEVCKAFPFARKIETAQDVKDWNDGKIRIAIGHGLSIGHGLNLQFGGHTVVWYSETYNAEIFDQFCARIARSGQTHPVSILSFIMKGTIEEKVDLILTKKLKTASEFIKNQTLWKKN